MKPGVRAHIAMNSTDASSTSTYYKEPYVHVNKFEKLARKNKLLKEHKLPQVT